MSDILTFETIRRIHKDEELSVKLSKIPDDFFEKATQYIKAKEDSVKNDPAAAQEFQNVKHRLRFIMETRERKILNMALYSVRTGLPPENLMPSEKPFFESILESLNKFKQLREDVLEPKTSAPLKVVAFTDDVGAFLGEDMISYGPFKKGDIASIPEKNSEILISGKKAEEMKIN
ncbi:MAG: DNA replication complex GINS family protein [Candidatus Aenigmarchaeota archaeon]|nr:DNA replication complex GINS family protein [Candidatus Aenigmarchaeota archaeon]